MKRIAFTSVAWLLVSPGLNSRKCFHMPFHLLIRETNWFDFGFLWRVSFPYSALEYHQLSPPSRNRGWPLWPRSLCCWVLPVKNSYVIYYVLTNILTAKSRWSLLPLRSYVISFAFFLASLASAASFRLRLSIPADFLFNFSVYVASYVLDALTLPSLRARS